MGLGVLDVVTRGAIDLPALIPPFGASTVIVFFAPGSLASRSWNVIAGHLGSALVASALIWLMPAAPVALVAALAVSGAGIWMVLSRSIHPPGGATALLCVLANRKLAGGLPLVPLLAGCMVLVTVRWLLDQAIELAKTRLGLVAPSVEIADP